MNLHHIDVAHYAQEGISRSSKSSNRGEALVMPAMQLDELLYRADTISWQPKLEQAQKGLAEATQKAAHGKKWGTYYHGSMLEAAAPLFTIPKLFDTIDTKVMQSGLRRTRKAYVGLISSIVETMPFQNEKQQAHLRGIANELACLAALSQHSTVAEHGYVPLPALPWQDDTTLRSLTHNIGGSDLNSSFDVLLMPLQPTAPIHMIQVKSRHHNNEQDYSPDITVLYAENFIPESLLPPEEKPELFKVIPFTPRDQHSAVLGQIGDRMASFLGISSEAA